MAQMEETPQSLEKVRLKLLEIGEALQAQGFPELSLEDRRRPIGDHGERLLTYNRQRKNLGLTAFHDTLRALARK